MSEKISVLTGATGHVGYALLRELLAQGERVRILIRKNLPLFDEFDCEKALGDVTDPDSLERAFQGAQVVYHLAGVIDINAGGMELLHKVNVQGTVNVVEACEKMGVDTLVYASSVDAIPPLPGNQTMTEIPRFSPEGLEGNYAKTKAEATQYVLDHNGPKLKTVVAHPSACIGPYDFKTSNVGEMVRMVMHGSFPVSLGFGAYNFVDVRDVAKGMYAAAAKGRPGECYILSGEAVSVDQFIRDMSEHLGQKAPGFQLPGWLADAAAPAAEAYYKLSGKTPLFTRYSLRKLNSNCHFSHEKATRELGYHPMSAKQSVSDMIDWIRAYEAQGGGSQ